MEVRFGVRGKMAWPSGSNLGFVSGVEVGGNVRGKRTTSSSSRCGVVRMAQEVIGVGSCWRGGGGLGCV